MIELHVGYKFTPTEHHDVYPAIDPRKVTSSGKVALITGASKGIGKAIAIAFAQAGISGIVLLARSDMSALESELLAAMPAGSNLNILSLSGDVTDEHKMEDAARAVKEQFGRLDFLVNNAGLMEPYAKVEEIDIAVWWRTWEVNVRGTYNPTRALLPLLLECGGEKTVINIGTMMAHFVQPNSSAYISSKLAMLRFTELLMVEYGEQGLLVYALHPGSVLTELAMSLHEADKYGYLNDTPELAAHTIIWWVRKRREWLARRYVAVHWDVDELEAKKDEIVQSDKLKMRMVV